MRCVQLLDFLSWKTEDDNVGQDIQYGVTDKEFSVIDALGRSGNTPEASKGDAGKDNNKEVADGPCNDERSHDASGINEALAANCERYKRRIDILIAGSEKL